MVAYACDLGPRKAVVEELRDAIVQAHSNLPQASKQPSTNPSRNIITIAARQKYILNVYATHWSFSLFTFIYVFLLSEHTFLTFPDPSPWKLPFHTPFL